MFSWWSKHQDVPERESKADLARLQELDTAILFKHSPSCPVSRAAHAQVESFVASNPSVPVYTISVRQHRELSQQIATWTNVAHESPQVIVLRRGAVVAAASHGNVTSSYLTLAVAQERELAI